MSDGSSMRPGSGADGARPHRWVIRDPKRTDRLSRLVGGLVGFGTLLALVSVAAQTGVALPVLPPTELIVLGVVVVGFASLIWPSVLEAVVRRAVTRPERSDVRRVELAVGTSVAVFVIAWLVYVRLF